MHFGIDHADYLSKLGRPWSTFKSRKDDTRDPVNALFRVQ